MAEKQKTMFKVARFRILKPADEMSWDELGKMIRDARYRVFRLANLTVSEAYLSFHLFRTGQKSEYKTETIGTLSRRLREMLLDEGAKQEDLKRYSRTGALPDTIVSALSHHKLSAITSASKWSQVIRGKVSLPTFRADMAIPIRCDKKNQRRLEKTESGNVELDLMICTIPYPRIILQTGDVRGSQRAILERLLNNPENLAERYRQRLFEIKQDNRTKKWWLYVTYEMPLQEHKGLNPDIIVGVDLGVSVPIYAAINNGLARLGRNQFNALGHRIRTLQRQVQARRRAIQRGGKASISQNTARSGHGRKRKLLPIARLQNRIDNAYRTLNHQLSKAVIDFALNHGAGTIQIEDLSDLKEELIGTFIGANWRYYQLQQDLEYKAKEVGITLKKINPRYTSRRCSQCGYINVGFNRKYRESSSTKGKVAEFICPQCEYKEDPDYNAARNISTIDIEKHIRLQCKQQGIEFKGSLKN